MKESIDVCAVGIQDVGIDDGNRKRGRVSAEDVVQSTSCLANEYYVSF